MNNKKIKAPKNYNKKASISAVGVFIFLFSGLVLAVIYYDFSNIDLGGLLFTMTVICCILVAKNTFDTVKSSEIASDLQESVSEDLVVSSEQLYIQLYKNSPVPYVIIDDKGYVKSANIAAVRMLGVSQTTIKGINVFTHLQCEEIEHLDLLVEKYNNGVSISDDMVKIKRSDNKDVWALLSLFGFAEGLEKRIGLMALVDITKQKKAEDAKSEFVSLASHQLRTPIAGMKWSAELLLVDSPETLTERQRKYIDRLLISVKRMALLVDDFLRVSRFELGTFKAEYKKINLTELFEDIMSEQQSRVREKDLVVKTFFDDSISQTITDSNLMRMIVTNLYSNATKYTRNGGTVHLGFSKKDDDILITVADNGMGIPVKDQDQIFSKLFRASNAVRDVPDGTGLGLYIVKEAVSVLRGSIKFTTTENVGTTFEVIMPLKTKD